VYRGPVDTGPRLCNSTTVEFPDPEPPRKEPRKTPRKYRDKTKMSVDTDLIREELPVERKDGK